MTDDHLMRLIYLVILLAAVGGWVLVESRGRLGQFARQALAWLLITVGLAAGYGLWQDMSFSQQRVVGADAGSQLVLERGRDRHFYLTLSVSGEKLRFMVDTGASSIVLSDRDSERLGIDRDGLAFTGTARTANGVIRTALVTLRDVTLEGQPMGDLNAWVGDGPLEVSLLGMDFLNRFAKVEIAGDRLTLTR